jgi:hypothetical protein
VARPDHFSPGFPPPYLPPTLTTRTFLSHLMAGLGSTGLFIAGAFPQPRLPQSSASAALRSDWRAIGQDLRKAMSRQAPAQKDDARGV